MFTPFLILLSVDSHFFSSFFVDTDQNLFLLIQILKESVGVESLSWQWVMQTLLSEVVVRSDYDNEVTVTKF